MTTVRFDPSRDRWDAACTLCDWTTSRRSRVGVDEAAEEHEREHEDGVA